MAWCLDLQGCRIAEIGAQAARESSPSTWDATLASWVASGLERSEIEFAQKLMDFPQDTLGLHAWGWLIVHGSILDINLGAPWLSIREPVISRSTNPKQVRAMAQRRVTPVGEWVLSNETIAWRISSRFGSLTGSEVDPQDPMHRDILQDLNGQKLQGAQREGGGLSLTFDLGGELFLWKYEDYPLCDVYHHGEHVVSIE